MQNDQSNLTLYKALFICFVIVFAITIYRALILWTLPSQLSLHFDEAQYWLWSQHLDWGYYSKPPMLAGIIAVFSDFFGDSTFSLRLPGLLFYPITCFILFFFTLKLFNNSAVALLASIIFITMPGISLSSMLITTDVILFVFWSISCYCLYLAVITNKTIFWLWLGLFAGLGLLTKYSMGIFAVCTALLLISQKQYRFYFTQPGPWLGATISLIIFSPNLIWNILNGWPSLRHTAELSSAGIEGLHFTTVLQFIGEQFGVFGLVSFAIYLVWLASIIKNKGNNDNKKLFLFYMSAPFLFIICLQALQGRAYANWAAPTYAMASIALADWLNGKKKFIAILIISNILVMLLIYHGDYLYDQLKPNASQGPDPMKTIRGWSLFSEQLQNQLKLNPSAAILVDDRETAAQTFYQLRARQPKIYYWNPDNSNNNHYEMNYSLEKVQTGPLLIVLKHPIKDEMLTGFNQITELTQFERQGKYKPIRRYFLYHADNFIGY